MDGLPPETLSLFQAHQVDSSVSASQSTSFFREYGVFYQANSEAGRLVAQLGIEGASWKPSNLKKLLPILEDDPVSTVVSDFVSIIYDI